MKFYSFVDASGTTWLRRDYSTGDEMKLYKCIDGRGLGHNHITEGKVYESDYQNPLTLWITVKNDRGAQREYLKRRFEEVEENEA